MEAGTHDELLALNGGTSRYAALWLSRPGLQQLTLSQPQPQLQLQQRFEFKLLTTEHDVESGEATACPQEKEATTTMPMPSDDVVDACKASNAHDFVSTFPQGYATDVGEGSTMVSGGQKQRIAVARALIKKPSVLLLDEATSALDAASERLVQQSIDELQQRKVQTTVVIAHRLSTVRNADKICVVEGGHIVEAGTHDELLALNGGTSRYAALWAKQTRAPTAYTVTTTTTTTTTAAV